MHSTLAYSIYRRDVSEKMDPSTVLQVMRDATAESAVDAHPALKALRDFRCKPAPPAEGCSEPGGAALSSSARLDYDWLPTLSELGYSEAAQTVLQPGWRDSRCSFPFSGGETAALQHLHRYLWSGRDPSPAACSVNGAAQPGSEPDVAHYDVTRNDVNGIGYSSKLSPWISAGCVSARRIDEELTRLSASPQSPASSTALLRTELLFRDHFRFLADKYGRKVRNRVCARFAGWIRPHSVFAHDLCVFPC